MKIIPSLIVFSFMVGLFGGQSANAAAVTWGTTPGSAVWNATNWTGANNPPITGDSLVFGASTQTTLNNDLTSAAFIIPNITFNSGSPAYTITGNAFTLGTSTNATVLTNSGTSLQTINDAITLGNATQTIALTAGGGNVTLGGNISGAGTRSNLTTSGAGALILSGTNAYAGQTTIGANSTLRATNTQALGTNLNQGLANYNSGAAAVTLNNGSVLDLRLNTAGTFGPGSGAGYSIAMGAGTSTINVDNDGSGTGNLITVGNLNMTDGGGTSVLRVTSGNGYGLNAGYLSGTGLPFTFKNDTTGGVTLAGVFMSGGGGSAGIVFDGTGNTTVTANLVRSSFNGAAQGLTKSGTGTVNLNGPVNWWGATTTVSAGTLNVGGKIGDMNAVSILTVQNLNTGPGSDVLLNLDSSWTVSALAGTISTPSSGVNTAAINLDGTDVTLTLRPTTTTSFQGVITGTGGLALTSPIRVNSAQPAPQSAQTTTLYGRNTYSGDTALNGATLKLDFSLTGAPTTNILNNASNDSTLVLGGGALILQGKNSTTNSQRFDGLDVQAGASTVTLTNNATANPLSLALGDITRTVPGGTVNFVNPTNGVLSATNGITTTAGNTNGILGGWATVGGTGWAINDGNKIVALSSYIDDTWAGGNNTTVTTGSAPASGSTTNSLRFNAAGAATLTLDGTNTITSGGILLTSAVGANASNITGGILRGAAGQDLIVIQNNSAGGMTIGSEIADNTTATGLTKSGVGTLTLTGANTYTGANNLNGGLVQISAANGLGNASAATNTITFNGGTLNSTSGTYDLGVNRSVALNGAGTFQIDSGVVTASGVVSGNGVLSKTGLGTLVLTGANTYGSETLVSAGVLNIRNNSALGTDGLGTLVNGGSTTPTTVATGATLQLQGGISLLSEAINISGTGASGQTGSFVSVSGANTIGRFDGLGGSNMFLGLAGNSTISVDSGSLTFINSYGLSNLTSAYNANSAPAYALTLGGAGNGNFGSASRIGNLTALTKDGTGMWTIALDNNSSANVVTTINAGVLSIGKLGNFNENTSIGKTTANLASNLVFAGDSTLRVGYGTSNRDFTINNGVTATLETVGSNTLTMTGSTVASTGSLTKAGTGSLILSGNHLYTGATTIKAGTLSLNFGGTTAPASNIISGSSALTMNGGTLALTGKSATVNSQTFNGTTIGSGAATVTLTQNSATSLTAVLGDITRNAGGTLNFSVAPAASGILATTTDSNVNGILGTWATTGLTTSLRYATQTGVSNQIGAYSGGTAAATAANLTDGTGTVNYDLAAATGVIPGAVSANTIRLATAGTTTLTASAFEVNGLMNASSGDWTINSNALAIGSQRELAIITNNRNIVVSSNIADNTGGASALTFSSIGGGTLSLSGSNSYSGATYINGATVWISAANNLGTSSQVYLNGGTLGSSTNTYDLGSGRAITLGGAGGTINSSTSGQTLTVSGSVNTAGNTLTVAGNGNTTISGIVSGGDGGISKTNAGTLTLTNANTYRGDTTVAANGGTLNIQHGSALGTTEGATTINNGATLQLQNNITVAEEALNLVDTSTLRNLSGNNTWAGPISLQPLTNAQYGSATITSDAGSLLTVAGTINTGFLGLNVTGAGDTTISGAVSNGWVGIRKTGAGTLTLSGVNAHSGETTVSAGVLAITSDAALGEAYDGSLGGYTTTVLGSGYNGNNVNVVTVDAPTTPGGTTAQAGAFNVFPGGTQVNGIRLSGSDGSGYIFNPTVTIAGPNTTPATVAAIVKGLVTLDGGTLRTDAAITSNRAVVITSNNGTIDTNGFNSTLSGIINNGASGSGSLTKTGAGSLTLSGANIYTGATIVNAGTLLVNGSTAAASAVTVGSTGTLGGTGAVNGTVLVQSGGTLAPGNSPGLLTQGATTLDGGGNYNWQIVDAIGTAGTGFDSITLTAGSALTLNNTSGTPFNINLWSLSSTGPDVNGNATNFDNTADYSWTLIATDQTISGFSADKFAIHVGAYNGTAGFSNGLAGGAFSVAVSLDGTDLLLAYTAIPEPTTWALLAFSLTTVLALRRRRRM